MGPACCAPLAPFVVVSIDTPSMIAGSLCHRIRRQPRLYRLLTLLVNQLLGPSRLRALVNWSTVPDLDVADPFFCGPFAG